MCIVNCFYQLAEQLSSPALLNAAIVLQRFLQYLTPHVFHDNYQMGVSGEDLQVGCSGQVLYGQSIQLTKSPQRIGDAVVCDVSALL